MARPTKPEHKDWDMHTLKKARLGKMPKGASKRADFVKDAIAEFGTEISNALATEQALRALQAHSKALSPGSHPLLKVAPNFWHVVCYGLFSSSVSAVGRIFDMKEGHGLQWYLAVCQSCIDVFSHDAIIARADKSPNLQHYDAPNEQYFEDLYQATEPCWKYFHQHFLPMRNQWIAHRVLATSNVASDLADGFDDAELDIFFGRLAHLHDALVKCFRGQKILIEALDREPKFNELIRNEADQLFSLTPLA